MFKFLSKFPLVFKIFAFACQSTWCYENGWMDSKINYLFVSGTCTWSDYLEHNSY